MISLPRYDGDISARAIGEMPFGMGFGQQEPKGRLNLAADADEIIEKVRSFETYHSIQLQDFVRYYKMFRAIPTKTRKENQSNVFLPELFVEIEALATAMQEMLFADDSDAEFFDVEAADDDTIHMAEAIVTKAALIKQIQLTDFKTKFLPFLRMLALYGTMPVATPWVLRYKAYWDDLSRVRKPGFDCWDYLPFSPIRFAFDDQAEDLESGEWCAETTHIRPKAALSMAKDGLWNPATVQDELAAGVQRGIYDLQQRQTAGYLDQVTGQKGVTAIEYYGTLESRNDGETYRAIVGRGGKFLIEPYINPYAHGEKAFLMAKWFGLPEEPFGLGIGHINSRQQNEINDRRNFINDLLYASLYSMWLKRADSGIQTPGNKMRWSPHQVIEGDMISDEFFRPIRPDMSPLGPAINLENADVEKMRRNSGATTTLQAVATGITATETQSIQSEATRRVKAQLRSNIASHMRRFLTRAHQMNLQFLDRPLSAKITHSEGYTLFGQVSREDLLLEPDIKMKLATDLDFRPFKRKELIELLQVFGTLQQNGMLGDKKIVPDPVIEEIAKLYNMDPRKFFSKQGLMEMETQRATQSPAVQQAAMRQVIGGSPAGQAAAKNAAQMAGIG